MILFIINFSNFDDLSGWVDMVFSKKKLNKNMKWLNYKDISIDMIESVDEETIEAYVSSYQQLLADNNQLVDQLLAPELEQVLNDPMVDNYFGNLLREIQMKQ